MKKKFNFLRVIAAAFTVLVCAAVLCGCVFQGPVGAAGNNAETVVADWEGYFRYLWDNELVDRADYTNASGAADYKVFLVRYPREKFVMPNESQHAAAMAVQSAVDIVNTDHEKGGAGVIYKLGADADGYTGDGYIVTNYHVISTGANGTLYTSRNVVVYLYKMTVGLRAEVVGGSAAYDIAILKITGTDRVFGDSPYADGGTTKDIIRNAPVRPVTLPARLEPALGLPIIAVGNPLGQEMSVTGGKIGMQSEYIQMESWYEKGANDSYRVMRIDAAVNNGNSGGGIFDMRGNLVGIVQARTGGEAVGMAYAIPLDIALRIADQIITRHDGGETGLKTIKKANFDDRFLGNFEVEGIYQRTEYSTLLDEVLTSETVRVVRGGTSGLVKNEVIKTMTVGGKLYRITREYQVDELFIEAGSAANIIFNEEII